MTKEFIAKEQVIRFNFDFFKFVNSMNDSASSAVDDLTFEVKPLNGIKPITGTETTAATKYNAMLGLGGYGQFTNLSDTIVTYFKNKQLIFIACFSLLRKEFDSRGNIS